MWGAEGERWVSDSVQGEHRVSRHEESGHLPWVGSVLKCVCVCVRETNKLVGRCTDKLPPSLLSAPPTPPSLSDNGSREFQHQIKPVFSSLGSKLKWSIVFFRTLNNVDVPFRRRGSNQGGRKRSTRVVVVVVGAVKAKECV